MALEKISEGVDARGGFDLWRRARELLTGTGLLVLGSKVSTAEIEEFAQESMLGSSTTSSGISSPSSSTAILSFEARFCRALGEGEASLRTYIDHRMRHVSKVTIAAFESKLSKLSEEEENVT